MGPSSVISKRNSNENDPRKFFQVRIAGFCLPGNKSHRRKGQSSSPAPNSKAKTDGKEKNLQKIQATEMKALQTKGVKFRACTEIVIIRHGAIGILPCVKNYKSEDANSATSAIFDMLRQMRGPAKSERKVVQTMLLNCVSQDPHPRKFFHGKREHWDQITP